MEQTFYFFGALAAALYVLKTIREDVFRAKAEWARRKVKKLHDRAHEVKDGIMPSIELTWEVLEGEAKAKEHADKLIKAESNGHSVEPHEAERYRKHVIGTVKEAFVAYSLSLVLVQTQEELIKVGRIMGETDLVDELRNQEKSMDQCRRRLEDAGIDLVRLKAEFAS
jgi:hypothetical protein